MIETSEKNLNGFRSRESKWVLQAINLPNVPLSVAAAEPMREDGRMAETKERGTAAVKEARQEGEGEPCQIGDAQIGIFPGQKILLLLPRLFCGIWFGHTCN